MRHAGDEAQPVTLYVAPTCGEPAPARASCSRSAASRSASATPRQRRRAGSAEEAGRRPRGAGAGGRHRTYKGYEESQWAGALESAGYPRERLPASSPRRGRSSRPRPAKAAARPNNAA
jgi:hypothetical protein